MTLEVQNIPESSRKCKHKSKSKGKEKHKRRSSQGKDSHSSRSSKRPRTHDSEQSCGEKRRLEKNELEQGLQEVAEMERLLNEARGELRASSSRTPRELVGERLALHWSISAESSVLSTYAGQDSWELYKACILAKDQAKLATLSHAKVEENGAHVFMQCLNFHHYLSLKCSYWQHEKVKADARIAELETRQKELEDQVGSIRGELDKNNAELKTQNDMVKNQNSALVIELERMRAELDAVKEAADRAHEEARGIGFAEGRDAVLHSEELKNKLQRTRLDGARAFAKSRAFRDAVEAKAAEYHSSGFKKCLSQLAKVKGLVDGFNPSLLDVHKMKTLRTTSVLMNRMKARTSSKVSWTTRRARAQVNLASRET